MGDLNYRITSDVPSQAIFDYAKQDYTYLLKKDQLLVTQRAGFAFQPFYEAPIHFPPTYKYLRFGNEYDQRPGKKVRAPSWCDRILYFQQAIPMDAPDAPVRITEYDHIPSYGSSDHKPVFARAVMLVKQYDLAVLRELYTQARTALMAGETTGIPRIVINALEVNLGELPYACHREHTIRIVNEGDVNVYYRFLPRNNANEVAARFFQVEPLFGVISPKQTKEVKVRLEMNLAAEALLAKREGILDEMIAFRVDNDRDYYIHFVGTVLATSFGQSLETLIRRTLPGRYEGLL